MIKPQEIPSWERNRHFWKQGIMALLAFFMFGLTKGYAQDTLNDSKDFSMDNPVVYEDAWDLWPYTFLEDGEPTGYNVELIKMIFEELGWPYEIKLKDTQKALEDLKNGKSDVMMGIKAPFHDAYGKYGNIVLNLFTHSVVYAKSEKQPIQTFNDLARNRVIVHKGSFSHHLMQGKGWDKNAIPYNDMKEAVLQVSTEGEGIIVWNTMSLKWLLNQYHADNLEIKPIDMPHGEYRFMSNNPKLLAMMDSAYAVLRADDRLQELQNKWFYPERKSTGIPSWVWMIANTLVVFLFGILGLYIFYTMRYRRVTRNIKRENARLALTLEASKVRIWIYDIKQQTVTWLDQNGNKKHEYTVLEFFSNYASQDMEKMLQALKRITSQEVETVAHHTDVYIQWHLRTCIFQTLRLAVVACHPILHPFGIAGVGPCFWHQEREAPPLTSLAPFVVGDDVQEVEARIRNGRQVECYFVFTRCEITVPERTAVIVEPRVVIVALRPAGLHHREEGEEQEQITFHRLIPVYSVCQRSA